MVFSTNTILESKKLKNNVNNIQEANIPDSWFEETLNSILTESCNFETMISESLVGSLLSFNISGSVTKGAKDKISNFNFESIFAKIFEWFISAITKLFRSFLAFLSGFLNKDLQLKSMKNKLANFRGSIRYTKDYYVYRNLEASKSYTSYQVELENVYDNISSAMSYLANCKSLTDIERVLNKIKDNNIYSVDEMDSLRGRVLGKNDPVSSADFPRELFKLFRTTEQPITPNVSLFGKNIDGNRVYEAYDSYFNSSKQEKIVKKDYMKMKFDAEKEKVKLKTLKLNDFLNDDVKLSQDLKQIYRNIIMDGCRKVKDICAIYSLFFSAKLDAMKEYNIMNRNILLIACKEIIKEG